MARPARPGCSRHVRAGARRARARRRHRAGLAPDVKVLAISFVAFLSGFRNDLVSLGKLCRDRGVFFFVDAIQGLGALRLDVAAAGIDALAADGHKWLCGPEGAGILYVARHAQERVRVTSHGWLGLARRGSFADYYAPPRPDARRYEPGTLNHGGIAGLSGAVETLLDFGLPYIEERVLSLAARLADGVAARGYRVLGSRAVGETSGIVSFARDGIDALALERRLHERRIVIGQREGFLRAAPHFYNTEDEIDALLAALP
ncbi:MAG: aminotransferase class V-fold PLP-dependent enzyme [Acidobacteriota bacterium]